MKRDLNSCRRPGNIAAAAVCALLAAVAVPGCGQSATHQSAATTRPVTAGIFNPPPKGGAQLWAENCTRCHYSRPPTQYSAQQWDLVVTHMRLRADLTGQEAGEIIKFLQSSN